MPSSRLNATTTTGTPTPPGTIGSLRYGGADAISTIPETTPGIWGSPGGSEVNPVVGAGAGGRASGGLVLAGAGGGARVAGVEINGRVQAAIAGSTRSAHEIRRLGIGPSQSFQLKAWRGTPGTIALAGGSRRTVGVR